MFRYLENVALFGYFENIVLLATLLSEIVHLFYSSKTTSQIKLKQTRDGYKM